MSNEANEALSYRERADAVASAVQSLGPLPDQGYEEAPPFGLALFV